MLSALVVAAVFAILFSVVPRRAAAGLGLIVLTALVTLVTQAPSDPYFADRLQAWEQGRFIRFHGAARWVGWFWPYAAIVYMFARLGARDVEPRNGSQERRSQPERRAEDARDEAPTIVR